MFSRIRLVGTAALLLFLALVPPAVAQEGEVQDVSRHLTVTDVREKSVRQKRSRRVHFDVTSDIVLKNTSNRTIFGPIRTIVNSVGSSCSAKVWTRSFSNVAHFDLTEEDKIEKILPGETVMVTVENQKPIRMRIAYEIVTYGVPGEPDDSLAPPPPVRKGPPLSVAKGVYAGPFRSFALKSDGSLHAWGSNHSGQLGDRSLAKKTSPEPLSWGGELAVVFPGGEHTLALERDGTLVAWGYNEYGQLGDGTTVQRNIPVTIDVASQWKKVTAGVNHTAAIKADGSLWTWGLNTYGQLGDGSFESRKLPVRVGTDTDWADVAAGGDHTAALKTDGSLWAWGGNVYGQLGDASLERETLPVRIGSASWSEVIAGEYHTLALTTEGVLWGWGLNRNGQLGDGGREDRHEPVRAGSEGDRWRKVSTGHSHSAGLKVDGSLWTWGFNAFGQLGDGTFDGRMIPVRVGRGNGWVDVEAGTSHTLAVKADGTLWAWGKNQYGQLGMGSDIHARRTEPELVPGVKLD